MSNRQYYSTIVTSKQVKPRNNHKTKNDSQILQIVREDRNIPMYGFLKLLLFEELKY